MTAGRLFLLSIAFLLASCGEKVVRPTFFADENPEFLSAWGALGVRDGQLVLGQGVIPYDLNTPLFTDYAHKLRTVWSLGPPAPYQETKALEMPLGTVITKTFYYPSDGDAVFHQADLSPVNAKRPLDLASNRLMETRLLVRREDGWHAISYVWDDDQTDAKLKRVGAVIPLTLATDDGQHDFAYVVPNTNQCAACHAHNTMTNKVEPLGPRVGQLNRDYTYAEQRGNQLDRWMQAGLMENPGSSMRLEVAWNDLDASLDDRARSYLASNCAHCHNPNGPADTSGLDLSFAATGASLGRCKPPIAAGSGTGGRRFGILPGDPDDSILIYRLASTDPGAMMPELGRALVHDEGVALMKEWIASMDGACT
ncbi:MAG: SO2930 family diheme c-type cytochrome [Pseudomonadota bacterium]